MVGYVMIRAGLFTTLAACFLATGCTSAPVDPGQGTDISARGEPTVSAVTSALVTDTERVGSS